MTTKKTAVSAGKIAVRKVALKKSPVRKSTDPVIKVSRPVIKPPSGEATKKVKKDHKKKVVRDSFTMPQDEYQKIADIKAVCMKSKMHVKKSEILRAGLIMLNGLSDARLKQALSRLEKIKTGRPKKH